MDNRRPELLRKAAYSLHETAAHANPGRWESQMVHPDMGGKHQYYIVSPSVKGPERHVLSARIQVGNAKYIVATAPPLAERLTGLLFRIAEDENVSWDIYVAAENLSKVILELEGENS